jgi:flagellar biogenesis protein FliO
LFSEETVPTSDSEPVFNLEEKSSPVDEAGKTGGLVPVWEFVRMLIILGCVVLVIYLFFFFLKKSMKRKMPENNLIKVIASTRLQGNDILYLIQLGYHYFLVGSGGNGLSQVAQITDKETIDTIMLNAAGETAPEKQSFSDILLRIFNPGKKQQGLISNPISFMKKQQERLTKLK